REAKRGAAVTQPRRPTYLRGERAPGTAARPGRRRDRKGAIGAAARDVRCSLSLGGRARSPGRGAREQPDRGCGRIDDERDERRSMSWNWYAIEQDARL